MATADGQVSRVVVQVLEPTLQFASAVEDMVVVVAGKEETLPSLLRQCRSIT